MFHAKTGNQVELIRKALIISQVAGVYVFRGIEVGKVSFNVLLSFKITVPF